MTRQGSQCSGWVAVTLLAVLLKAHLELVAMGVCGPRILLSAVLIPAHRILAEV